MVNFHPDLEKSTDDKLLQYINNSGPEFGSLASDELTRRQLAVLDQRLAKLDDSINRSADNSETLERSNFRLQIVMLALTGVTTVIAAYNPILSILNFVSKPVAELINDPSVRTTDWALLASVISVIVGALVAYTTGRIELDGEFIVFKSKKKQSDEHKKL